MRFFWLNVLNILIVQGVFGVIASLKDFCTESCDIVAEECAALVHNAYSTYPNHVEKRTPDLISMHGYPVETHEVTSSDGYKLTMYRIPYSNSTSEISERIPVYLVHGILASSVQWMWQPPTKALVFMLADAGFDVWIGNSRGTSYSKAHSTYDSSDLNDLRYWDFSFHEMGLYDLPATINYILSTSGQGSLYYIGHSMGTTQFFSGIMMNPSLGSKIRTIFSLATSGYIGNMTNLFFRSAAPYMAPATTADLINVLGNGEFLPALMNEYMTNFTEYCSYTTIDCTMCNPLYGALFGFDPCQADFTQLPGVLAHLPDSTSARTFSHVAQDATYGTFRQYNWGPTRNLQIYGSLVPPAYNWSQYNVPTVIFYGDNDNLAVPMDVKRTASALGSNLKHMKRIPCRTFSHMDFVLGKDADVLLYQPMIQIMKNQTYG